MLRRATSTPPLILLKAGADVDRDNDKRNTRDQKRRWEKHGWAAGDQEEEVEDGEGEAVK